MATIPEEGLQERLVELISGASNEPSNYDLADALIYEHPQELVPWVAEQARLQGYSGRSHWRIPETELMVRETLDSEGKAGGIEALILSPYGDIQIFEFEDNRRLQRLLREKNPLDNSLQERLNRALALPSGAMAGAGAGYALFNRLLGFDLPRSDKELIGACVFGGLIAYIVAKMVSQYLPKPIFSPENAKYTGARAVERVLNPPVFPE